MSDFSRALDEREKAIMQIGYVLAVDEGIPIPNQGKQSFLKITGNESEGRFSLHESEHPPGYTPGLHLHTREDEYIYLLEGRYRFFMADQWHTGEPGSFVFIPKGMPHGFQAGAQGGKMLVMFSPAGMDNFWREYSRAEQEGKLTDAFLQALAEKYGLKLLGPLPEDE
jgi:quercetin dioxygenase-like cupin family protein